MFTKTQIRILEVFTAHITEKYSINKIAQLLKKPYPLIHKSVKYLLQKKMLVKDQHKLLSVNIKEHHAELAYVESLRREALYKRHTFLSLFFEDFEKSVGQKFFVALVFGSTVETRNPRDIDILVIIESMNDVEQIERILQRICERYAKNFDAHVIPIESVYEMLAKREEKNVMNETLNKHIILWGGENYYRFINNGRR
ncbi:hypothetical protein J4410_06765 [Candidatus Woesearchaeota archaeon]|nr:hypothetical protein [Candidatus Woesearchaeota archaeon]